MQPATKLLSLNPDEQRELRRAVEDRLNFFTLEADMYAPIESASVRGVLTNLGTRLGSATSDFIVVESHRLNPQDRRELRTSLGLETNELAEILELPRRAVYRQESDIDGVAGRRVDQLLLAYRAGLRSSTWPDLSERLHTNGGA